jgi:tetratricopeptide (TPR) repeat protein
VALNNFAEAAFEFKKGLTFDHENINCLVGYANAEFKLKNLEYALEALLKAASISPDNEQISRFLDKVKSMMPREEKVHTFVILENRPFISLSMIVKNEEHFLEACLESVRSIVDEMIIGMPWTNNVNITPLPEFNKTKWMNDYVQDAIANGAKLLNNVGKIINTIFTPGVVGPGNDKMNIYHEEQFGLVVPYAIFDDINQPIDDIVNSKYGQQVSLFSTNPDTIAKMTDILANQVCRINLNSQPQRGPDEFPFAGRKDSAVGTLSITDALKIFGIRSMVAAKDNDMNKKIIEQILEEDKSKFITNKYLI